MVEEMSNEGLDCCTIFQIFVWGNVQVWLLFLQSIIGTPRGRVSQTHKAYEPNQPRSHACLSVPLMEGNEEENTADSGLF